MVSDSNGEIKCFVEYYITIGGIIMRYVLSVIVIILLVTTSALTQTSNQPYRRLLFQGVIEQIAYFPDSSLLAVASHDGLYLYDARAWNEPL